MSKNGFGLEINKDVIARIAGTAAIEVNGVAGLSSAPINSKINIKNPIPGASNVLIKTDNGALIVDIYVKIYKGFQVRPVAEEIQNNVKDKIQTMTGTPVALVNVIIAEAVEKPTPETDNENENETEDDETKIDD